MHNYRYTLKTLFKNRMMIFWTFAFPIILGTLFHLAFSNLEESEQLNTMPIAIVDNMEFQSNEALVSAFTEMSDETSEDPLFTIQYVDEEKAKALLKDEEIIGYVFVDASTHVMIKNNGVEQTVFKLICEEIIQSNEMINTMIEEKMAQDGNMHITDPTAMIEQIKQDVMERMQEETSYLNDTSSEHMSYVVIEFYTLIAMACLYGGMLGMFAVNCKLANMSHHGKRVAVSPTAKGKLIFTSVLAGYTAQLVGIALLFAFLVGVLHIDFGDNLPLITLLALVGSFAGLTIGIAIATLVKSNENMKAGIFIALTMLGCFLSGMMGVTMKYVVDTNLPFVNRINPAGLITDGFYALYYYETLDRYTMDMIALLLFSFVMIFISMFQLRRQRYDSI